MLAVADRHEQRRPMPRGDDRIGFARREHGDPVGPLDLLQRPRHGFGERGALGVQLLDQMRKDLEELDSLGAAYVLLDSAGDDPQATRHHEPVWRMLTTLAEKALDLPQQTLR